MIRKAPHYLLAALFVVIFVSSYVPAAYAVFTMAVQSTSGSQDLSFGNIGPDDFKKAVELNIRITSDISKKYTLSQRLIQPMATMDGTPMDENQFRMYPLIDSNSRGTLLFKEEVPLNRFDTTLYTSDPIGSSDSFKIVYTITPSQSQLPGSYYGRIVFVMVPLNSSAAQVVVTVNVYVTLAAGSAPVVEVKTGSGSDRLFLTTKDMSASGKLPVDKQPQIFFKISRPLGAAYTIYQLLGSASLATSEGYSLDLARFPFSVEDVDRQGFVKEGNMEPGAKIRLYTSDTYGGPVALAVTLRPAKDFIFQRPGLYKGRLEFILEVSKPNVPAVTFAAFDIEVEIAPILELRVTSGGKEGLTLDFGKAGSGKIRTSEADVEVTSNMGEPYQVVQRIGSPLMNKDGEVVPDKDFRFLVKSVESKEEPRAYAKTKQAVKQGDTAIFVSGLRGESARFKVAYELSVANSIKPGAYSNKMVYSLSLE